MFKTTALLAVSAIAVLTAGSTGFQWKTTDKAYYADAATVNFVRPGLVMKITSAAIANSDGTMSVRVTIADPKGLPLDREGVTTPGAVSISCVMAVLPRNDNEFKAYTTRNSVSTINGHSAVQAATDSGGTWKKNADGDYTYTFKTKATNPFDPTATHRAGCQASRSLSDFSLPTNFASAVLDFVPNGAQVTQVHDVVRTATCNNCHGDVAFHGGSRRGVEYCVMCHTKQSTDPDTGNTVDMPVMIHKIHMGENLPSVKAGTPYQIIGFQNGVSDWSSVALPSDPGRCVICHDPKSGAAQATNFMTKPNRNACGACHDDVNFATGQNHVNLPQLDDKQCSNCHIPQGELPLDASIMNAHVNTNAGLIPDEQNFVPGMVFDKLVVKDGSAGKAPTITFTMKDKSGAPIALSSLKASPGRLAAVLAGPSSDYGYTSFGSDQTTGGYISEDVVNGGGSCDASGNCSFTFKHSIPATATGTYAIGLEGRRGITILAGTQKAVSTEYGAHNKVAYFSVDGSAVTPRRQVVALANCNNCHSNLSLHGTNRDQIDQCVLCHNASETDKSRRPATKDPVEKAKAPQAISFAYMIHRIHTGEELKAQGAGYTVVGFGGSVNDFSEVRYPVFTPEGSTANTANCAMCHVNGSETKLPEGLQNMTNPQSKWNPTPITTAACTGCHATSATLSHAYANTTQFGESCSVCHGASGEFAVSKVHAQ